MQFSQFGYFFIHGGIIVRINANLSFSSATRLQNAFPELLVKNTKAHLHRVEGFLTHERFAKFNQRFEIEKKLSQAYILSAKAESLRQEALRQERELNNDA